MRNIKIIIDINHPAHVHFFKNLYFQLVKDEYEVRVTSTTKEISELLLNIYNIPYVNMGTYRKGLFKKFIDFLIVGLKFTLFCFKFKPDYILSISSARPFGTLVSKAKFFVFTDTEHAKEQIKLFKPFATKIYTPDCFTDDLGPKQIRYAGYHELAYLHPDRFTPNPEVLKEIGLTENDKFFVVRFVSWEATHDVGQKGLSIEDKRKLIETLKPHGKIIISSEKELPEEFEEYRMKICPTKMHDLLYYATMYLGEGGTMASEAACLGTYSIYMNSLPSMGYIKEEIEKYNLIYKSIDIKEILNHLNSIDFDRVKLESNEKANKIVADKIDVTKFIYDLKAFNFH
ncbi:MAG: DUF354 domain-containing protein [Ignavibacteriae bacterium]|nr:DUF354 domain-containing protein [Ignavibacteriota bacterium]